MSATAGPSEHHRQVSGPCRLCHRTPAVTTGQFPRQRGADAALAGGTGIRTPRQQPPQGWRNDSRGGGTRPWGPSRKRVPKCLKGPKPIQLLQLLKNSPREVKRAHFRYILGPPRSHPGNGIYGARRGRSLPVPPGFSSHDSRQHLATPGPNLTKMGTSPRPHHVPTLRPHGPIS